MTALETYRAQYNEEKTWYADEKSKYEWVAGKVFELTTYDGGLDERFVKDIIEVCTVILERRNFEYIEDENNYVKYILVCQLLDRFNWINWGTSIRGAWFEVDECYIFDEKKTVNFSRDILEDLEWWDDKHNKIEKVPFTVENLKALIEFMVESDESMSEPGEDMEESDEDAEEKTKLKTGYCPICDKDVDIRTSHSMADCPVCGHHLVMHEKTDA